MCINQNGDFCVFVFFSERPEESLISDLIPDNHIMSPEDLCKELIFDNNVICCLKNANGDHFSDADRAYNPDFNFDK